MRFADLFCGIGGFHAALSDLGHECVFACDSDKYASIVYERNLEFQHTEISVTVLIFRILTYYVRDSHVNLLANLDLRRVLKIKLEAHYFTRY